MSKRLKAQNRICTTTKNVSIRGTGDATFHLGAVTRILSLDRYHEEPVSGIIIPFTQRGWAAFELPLGELTREMVAPLPISLINILIIFHDPEHW